MNNQLISEAQVYFQTLFPDAAPVLVFELF